MSFINTASSYQPFPPTAGHSGTVADDVAYARLVDDSGAGAPIWESTALNAGSILVPYIGVATANEGVYIDSFVITLTDAQITGASMPLRLEVFLYDSPVSGTFPALDPGAPDPELYSYYSGSGDNNTGWYSLINIGTNEVKNSNLSIILPIL